MRIKKSLPGPIPIIMIVIVLAAICTWTLPAGQYRKLSVEGNTFIVSGDSGNNAVPLTQRSLDSLGISINLRKFTDGDIRKPISVPGTFTREPRHPQGFLQVLRAPIKGIIDSVEIILFILIIGGFMFVFNETGAMEKGITALAQRMKGREKWLIIILTIMFSFFGGSYGMAEESLVFYPILVPLFLAAGYDLIVPFAIIFGGTSIGATAGFSNPFSTIIAANAAGINWLDGLEQRLVIWAILTALLLWYVLRYASRVKKDPNSSIGLQTYGIVEPIYPLPVQENTEITVLSGKNKLLLAVYILSFLAMIGGVVFLQWWTMEMSALFLGSSILVAIIAGINEKTFIREFISGAGSLLSVAFIIGVARGVTVILTEGHISDSILFFASNLVHGLQPAVFIMLLLLFYIIFSLFIQSSSGMAVLTMPIIGALAILVNIPGREIVNAYMFGMGVMSFVAPTGLVLPALAMVNVSYKAWLKFIFPLLAVIFVVCVIALLAGIYI